MNATVVWTWSVWVCAVLAAPGGLYAQMLVGTAFTYQGRLTENGQPADGQYDFEFTLYDSMGLPMVNVVTIDDHQVSNGLFAVQLDFGDMFWGDAIQLEVAVRPGASTGAYTLLWPRQALTATPYALYALHAPGSSGLTLPFSQTFGNDVYEGVPAFRITDTVNESPAMWATTSGTDNYSVYAEATGESSIALYGSASGLNGCAVQASTFGSASTAISGWANGSPPQGQQNTGGYFYAASDTGIGVYGEGKYGLHGKSTWVGGTGVLGQALAGSGTGVRGETDAANGTGVYGSASSGTGLNYGVQGQTNSSAGYGVYGYNSAEFDSAVAVYGSVNPYNSEAYGGYFEGNGYFESTLSVGGYVFADGGIDTQGAVSMSGFRLDNAPQAGHVLTSDASGYGTWQPLAGGSLWQEFGYDIFYNAGNVGIRVSAPDATLHVAGGNGDLVGTEGDFKIGDSTYRLKMGVTTSGGVNGECRIFAGGPSSRLILGANGQEQIVLTGTNVGIGTSTPSSTAELDVAGRIEMDYFRLTNAPAAGYVLTSDASGNGTWQAATGGGGLALPYDGTVDSDTPGFTITNDNMYATTTGSLGGELTGVEGHTSTFEGVGVAGHNDFYGSYGQLGQGKNGVMAVTPRSDAAAAYFINTGGGPALVASGGVSRVDVLQIMGGSDLAEQFDVGGETKPGMVVMIDPDNPGKLRVSRGAYNRCVAGVISGANGVHTGMVLANLPGEDNAQPVALSGRVWVCCDASDKAIKPGDMLTTASMPGHAMAVTDFDRAHGAVLGKAMSRLDKGTTGMVLALVNLQ